MIPYSIIVAFTGSFLGLAAIAAFVLAWWGGAFDQIDEHAEVILEPRDLRLQRPWETPAEQEERRQRYGELIEPEPGEWGGGA